MLAAQRASVASHQAQEELDRLSKTAYDKLGLTSTPASSADPLNPGFPRERHDLHRQDRTHRNLRALDRRGPVGSGRQPHPDVVRDRSIRGDGHRQDLPVRHLAGRELRERRLRWQPEHEARHRRGHDRRESAPSLRALRCFSPRYSRPRRHRTRKLASAAPGRRLYRHGPGLLPLRHPLCQRHPAGPVGQPHHPQHGLLGTSVAARLLGLREHDAPARCSPT